MPDELRPLCINLLGSGLDERRSLETSVGGILRKNEEWNEDRAKQERTHLEECLREHRKEKAELDRRLRDIRESETYPYSIAEGVYQGTAARIAEAINRDRSLYGWFTDSVQWHETCPITVNDLENVLESLRQFTPEKRKDLGLAWPKDLPSIEEFNNLVKKESSAIEEEQILAPSADEWCANLLAKYDPSIIEAIYKAFLSFFEAYRKLKHNSISYTWISDAFQDVLSSNSSLWHERLRVTHDVIASIEGLAAIADETAIEFPDHINIRQLYEDTCQIKKHLENGGKLGWWLFRPKPVRGRLYVIKTVKISGQKCTAIEHFSSLADALHVRIECERAWSFWKGITKNIEGPYTLQVSLLKSLHNSVKNTLALEELVSQCRKALKQCPELNEPVWIDESSIEKLIASCKLALTYIHKKHATEEIKNIEAPISRMNLKSGTHPVTNDLLNAIRNRDVGKFEQCVYIIQNLEKLSQQFQKMNEDLSNLHRLLPQFTTSLEQTYNEPHWEKRIENIIDAWHWAQARCWIEDYIRKEDAPALDKRAKQIEDEINDIIAKLASLHAWSFCFSRLTEDRRRHMEAWWQSMRQLGMGTGKYAPRHRREAQKHLNECREAVPAWVMPLHRVWDTVYPNPGIFDVVIIDEASQCGNEALPLLYLGKKILIVGDDKQISPEAVGVELSYVFQYMDELLYDFEHKSSFDIKKSFFDHGRLRYGTRRITLREHFRCMPEIINFSNDLCYSDTPLIPLRQYGPDRLPPLEHVFVKNGYREGSNSRVINRQEAEKIVERIVEMCKDSRYDGKTIGVVVLQGEAQAGLIETQLLERIGAEEMERRRLICGNPYSFQGDERDIILLSLVAAINERIGPLTEDPDKRRFNVAASRARDQMILFHSVTPEDLSVHDLRRRLLEFFLNTKPQQITGTEIDKDKLERQAAKENRSVVKSPVPFESWFEVDVALELLRKGYTVIPQYEFAGRWIDLVVEGGQTRLAVECDGDNWHGAERYEEDMQRQRQLERCGWEFFRVRESAFYANKEKALERLWGMLEERGILSKFQNSNLFQAV